MVFAIFDLSRRVFNGLTPEHKQLFRDFVSYITYDGMLPLIFNLTLTLELEANPELAENFCAIISSSVYAMSTAELSDWYRTYYYTPYNSCYSGRYLNAIGLHTALGLSYEHIEIAMDPDNIITDRTEQLKETIGLLCNI